MFRKARVIAKNGVTSAARTHATRAVLALDEAAKAVGRGDCGYAKWTLDHASGHLKRARKAKLTK